MGPCRECFNDDLPLRKLPARCATVSVAVERNPTLKAIVTWVCPHGVTHHQCVFPGSGEQWAAVCGLTDNLQRCGVVLPPLVERGRLADIFN